ncbi:hypothetical protein MXEN_09324 [Mycobacterium xenopi RIVM700367]|nr:hypothetical protein MXEN_09324 [Mycobacterium xenopi RIVM700367]
MVDSSTNDYDVLEQAMEEAQLRELPLHVVTMLRRISPELARNRDSKEASQVTAGVEESLVDWSRYYPGIEIHMEQTDQFVKYALEHQRSIRLVVVDAEHHDEVTQLIEMTRPRVLHDASFSVFVIRNQHP